MALRRGGKRFPARGEDRSGRGVADVPRVEAHGGRPGRQGSFFQQLQGETNACLRPLARAPVPPIGPIVLESARLPLAERIEARARELPQDALDGLPNDLEAQHDHYLDGTPKRPE
jgi:hypothetical protein